MRRLLGPLVAAALAASGLSIVGIASGHGLNAASGGGCAAADGLHHATLVVEHGDQWAPPNAALSRCVAFASSITGEDLLSHSGVQYSVQNYSGNGDAVCQVDYEPRTYSSCFQDGRFWALFQSRSGAHGSWSYSSQGIGSLSLNDGDAVGLRYQSQSSALPPPSPLGTCPPPLPPATLPATPAPPATLPPRSATPGRTTATTSPPTSGAVITGPPAAPPTLSIPSTPGPASAGTAAAAGHASVVTTTPPPAPPPRPGAPLAPLLAGGTGAGLLALLVLRAVKARRS